MAQIQPEWIEIEEFSMMSAKLIEKYPNQFAHIDVEQLIAYSCVNKDRPERNKKPYDIGNTEPPESFTNSKTFFVKIFNDVWEKTEEQKLLLVYSALSRIDDQRPGKLRALDYTDQEMMVNTFGAHWHERGNLPNILDQHTEIR